MFYLLSQLSNPRLLKQILKTLHRNPFGVVLILILLVLYLFLKFHNSNTVPSLTNPQKQKAKYPTPPKRLLYKEPKDCVVLGKWKKQYVCKPLSESGHVLVIGGSGSGKSSALAIPSLLSNKNTTNFSIDVKGELSYKSVDLSQEKNIIFNPTNKSTYGYDPFWRLHSSESYTEQMLYDSIEEVVFSLLPSTSNESNPYWSTSGRALLIGLMMYEYHCGYTNLIDIIDQVQSQTIESLLSEVEEVAEPSWTEYRILSQFFDLADTTLSGVYSTAMQKLTVFTADADIRYAFRDNPKKMNPSMLEEQKNIFLSIPEECLEKYSTILHLVINQSFSVLTRRPEKAPPICYMIDELPRLLSSGRISSLLDAARTLRSRNVTLFLVVQSLEALEIAFSNKEAVDLVSNCPYIVVLSASSEDTIRKVGSWVGKYMSPHYSYNGTGAEAKISVSYSEQNIIDGMELMTLTQSGEAILSTPYGYFRVKKASYFSDKYFLPLHKKVVEINSHLADLQKQSIPEEIPTPPPTPTVPPIITDSMKESLLEWDESIISLEELDFDNDDLEFNNT